MVRVWLAFVAVPVSACGNALVAFRVIREARVRAMGPSFVHEVSTALLDGGALSPAWRGAALRAVASAIVRTHDLHPNLIALLHAVQRLLREARAACGLSTDLTDVHRLRRAFLSGQPRSEPPLVAVGRGTAG